MDIVITTAPFDDLMRIHESYDNQPRTNNTDLSYDYIILNGGCGPHSPTILDTDGRLALG